MMREPMLRLAPYHTIGAVGCSMPPLLKRFCQCGQEAVYHAPALPTDRFELCEQCLLIMLMVGEICI